MVRDPQVAHLSTNGVVSGNSASQHRSVRNVEFKSLLFKHGASLLGLHDSLLSEGNIVPASEPVVQVPLALSVADEYNSVQVFGALNHQM